MDFHKSLKETNMENAFFISQPKIDYFANSNCGIPNSIIDFLIRPKSSDKSVVNKFENLSYIALKKL